MTDFNHTRKNRKPVNQRYRPEEYHNGLAPRDGTRQPMGRIGRTDYLDKSMRAWERIGPISDTWIGAWIPNDFTNGHRGMAREVRGAKKFVRSRVRFHENAATRRLAREVEDPLDHEPPAG